MRRKTGIISKIGLLILLLAVTYILIQLYGTYKQHYYNGFIKAENNRNMSQFKRDTEVKYSKDNSYKIESKRYNDAIFYKEVEVKPNTPYRIRCMVKTEEVINESSKSNSGAQICIVGSTESSVSITGTNEWQELEFMFNSKNRNKVTIGFRLGGNKGNCKGTAWFSDFVLEEGTRQENSNWNMACFIFRNTEVEISTDDGIESLSLSMTNGDVNSIKDTMERFKVACNQLSNNQMSVTYDIYEISDPITSLSYSEEFGYYIDPTDVEEQLREYLEKNDYDHIFVVVRLGDVERDIEIPVYDWIGLGGMDLYDIGFSNIRLPNDRNNYIYTYYPNVNHFPEEVMLHEFLHSLERIMSEYDYDIPALHDNEVYGYEEEKVIGLKRWYTDYMSKGIWDETKNEYVGLEPIVYKLKPVKRSDFEFAREIVFNEEPVGFFDEVRNIFKVIKEAFIRQET